MSNDATIRKYLIETLAFPLGETERFLQKLQGSEQIYQEFLQLIKTEQYPSKNPVEIAGYTAEKIFKKASHLNPAQVYDLLLELEKKPEETAEFIRRGAPLL